MVTAPVRRRLMVYQHSFFCSVLAFRISGIRFGH
jgi:hypothetical protein